MKSETGYVQKWLRSIHANIRSCISLFRVFKRNKLTFFAPFIGLLLILSVVLYVISFSTPLAPFVYSLF